MNILITLSGICLLLLGLLTVGPEATFGSTGSDAAPTSAYTAFLLIITIFTGAYMAIKGLEFTLDEE